MGDPRAAPEPFRPPGKRRWKLWHLAVLVAASAVVMAAAVRVPGFVAGLVLIALFLAPPYWAASVVDRYLLREDERSLSPTRPTAAFFVRVCWFVCFLFPYSAVILVLSAIAYFYYLKR